MSEEQLETLDKFISQYFLAETHIDLIQNDDWNWFENRNGSSAKLRAMEMHVFKRGKMPYSMFSISFRGKLAWLRGGFWLTWDDFLKGITSILNQMGYEVITKERYKDALVNAFNRGFIEKRKNNE